MVRIGIFSSFVVLASLPSLTNAQGRLADVRREVRDEPEPKPAPTTKTTENPRDSESTEHDWHVPDSPAKDEHAISVTGNDFLLALLWPLVLPRVALNDDGKHLAFTRSPYFGSYSGYQILPTEDSSQFYGNSFSDIPRRNWALRTAIDNGNDFRGLNRAGLQVHLDHTSRFGISTSWNWYRETLSNGSSDDIVIGDINLTYRFARNEIASVFAGVGVRTLSDRSRTDLGVNFTYGGDWFPVRPLVVSTVFDAGTIGSTVFVHARGTVGLMYRQIEFFGGYDFLRIGSTNLEGPLLGLRLWF